MMHTTQVFTPMELQASHRVPWSTVDVLQLMAPRYLNRSPRMRVNVSTRDQFSFVGVECCCVDEINIRRLKYNHLDTCDAFIFSKRLRVWYAAEVGAAAVSTMLRCPGITVLHLDGIHQITRTLQSDGSDLSVLPGCFVIEWCSVQSTVEFCVTYRSQTFIC